VNIRSISVGLLVEAAQALIKLRGDISIVGSVLFLPLKSTLEYEPQRGGNKSRKHRERFHAVSASLVSHGICLGHPPPLLILSIQTQAARLPMNSPPHARSKLESPLSNIPLTPHRNTDSIAGSNPYKRQRFAVGLEGIETRNGYIYYSTSSSSLIPSDMPVCRAKVNNDCAGKSTPGRSFEGRSKLQ
jgi:hypothetical protein